MIDSIRHPRWCVRRFCTALAGAEIERRYHRSRPLILPTDDPVISYYIHLGANPDGTDPYLEIAELEEPGDSWWHPAAGPLSELIMPVDRAAALHRVLTGLLRQVWDSDIESPRPTN